MAVQELTLNCVIKVSRVARLIRKLELVATKPRRFVVITDSRHDFPIAQNLLNREYQVEFIPNVNRTWAGDITYISTAQGWLYLAVVLDLKSRKVVGWSMKDTMDKSLVQEALTMATQRRLNRPMDENLIFHSDRSNQYASGDYRDQLEQWSMSRKGNCWDNAPVESFLPLSKRSWFIDKNTKLTSKPKPDRGKSSTTFRSRDMAGLGFLYAEGAIRPC